MRRVRNFFKKTRRRVLLSDFYAIFYTILAGLRGAVFSTRRRETRRRFALLYTRNTLRIDLDHFNREISRRLKDILIVENYFSLIPSSSPIFYHSRTIFLEFISQENSGFLLDQFSFHDSTIRPQNWKFTQIPNIFLFFFDS